MAESNRPLRVLSLDGGGVRGLASLIILYELMEQIRRELERLHGTRYRDPIKPCEYFDLICGTSTGGLIALMLGRLRYDVPTAIRKYLRLSKNIFTSKYPGKEAQFDHTVLVEGIRRVIADSPLRSGENISMKDESFFPTPGGGCRTFVISASLRGTGATPVLMRTYGSPRDSAFRAKVWEAARATSAAPTFFKPIVINGVEYGDGGTGWNNPTLEAIIEAGKIWGERPIGCLISLGTGFQDPSQLLDRSGTGLTNRLLRRVAPGGEYKLTVAKYLISCLTNCERVHNSISSQLGQYNLRGRYHRLNPHGMGGIGLEEWQKIGDIKALAESYMMQGEMGDLKVKLANCLLDPSTCGSAPTISPPSLDPPHQAKLGDNTLHLAALNGNVQKVRQILNQEYVGLNEKESERGWTPLMCAVSEGHDQIVKLLLDAWAKTDIPSKQLMTPLHLAVIKRQENIVRLLLQKDPETNTKDIYGQTPLHYAAARGELDVIVQLLLKSGAEITTENIEKNCALDIAVCNGSTDLVDYLLQAPLNGQKIQETFDKAGFFNDESSLRMQAEARNNPVGLATLFMALDAKRMDIVSLLGKKYLLDDALSEAIENSIQSHNPEVPYPSWEDFTQNLMDIGRESLGVDYVVEEDAQSVDSDDLDVYPKQAGAFPGMRQNRARPFAAYQEDDDDSSSTASLDD